MSDLRYLAPAVARQLIEDEIERLRDKRRRCCPDCQGRLECVGRLWRCRACRLELAELPK